MKKKTECKIVQDLLPTYIDELTDSETNLFIEEHIKNCSECEQALKDMQGEIKLEKINNLKKIDALKKVKNRYKRIVVISILSIILILILGLYFWNNYRFEKNEDGKLYLRRFTYGNLDKNNYTNVIINYKYKQDNGTIDGYVYITYILTFDENNKCVNARKKEKGYTKNELNYVYTMEKNAEKLNKTSTNIKIVNEDSIIYNDNTKIEKNKEEILNIFINKEELNFIEY